MTAPFRDPSTREDLARNFQQPEIVWVPFNGKTVAVNESVRTAAPWNAAIREWFAFLETAGSTNTVLTLYVMGVSVGTLTIPAGSTDVVVVDGLSIPVSKRSKVKVVCTTAGTGAAELGGGVLLRRRA
jgi:hypothetical protein